MLLKIATMGKQFNLGNKFLGVLYFPVALNILAVCLPFSRDCCSFSYSMFSPVVVVNTIEHLL